MNNILENIIGTYNHNLDCDAVKFIVRMRRVFDFAGG